MTPPSPSDRAGHILASALDHATEDREAFLKTACGDDAELLAEVRALLAAHETAPTEFLASPTPGEGSYLSVTIKYEPGKFPSDSATEKPGERIGRYKLLQEIGEGGFGTVWMAEQVEPVTRRVALKIIKLGMDTREVVARFEAERQALAMMDHPNIAKVLDAGATERGRPYFVMELVKGIPITQYCDEAGLGTRERLALFGDVCSAINHAHQKGVIHRDIKPSNVMITLHGDKPVVKVIDFGIAKATQGKLTDKTLFTRFEQFIGTPVYMSPEQASLSGLDVDTRSDIYALGILLYELLVGRPPFDPKTLATAGYEEMRRIIREVEPVKPSSRLSTIMGEERTQLAKARHIDPALLNRIVEPDLDWIVMKAIDKDRTRRYETANGLALDIQRFLSDEPVSATPPTAAYRFRKFARRYRAAIRVAASIFVLLLGASIVSSWLAIRASRARASEEVQRLAAQAEARRANEAEQRESQERLRAETQEAFARRRAYAADMLLCQRAVRSNNLREARQLLDRQRPADGEEDLRGWEWRRLWADCKSDALFELGRYKNRPLKAVYVDGGKSVVTYEDDGEVRRIDLDSRQSELLQEPRERSWLITNSGLLCLSADRRWMAAEGMDDAGYFVQVWDLVSKAPPRRIALGKERASAIAISNDGSQLGAFMVHQDAVHFWDISAEEAVKLDTAVQLARNNQGFSAAYGAIQYSPDGQTLAVGGFAGDVRLLNAADLTFRRRIPNRGATSTLAFSPDSQVLAVGTMFIDPRVTIWNVEDGERIRVLEGHAGFITALDFSSPDGKLLASASGDQTIKLWDTGTWEERTTLMGHTDEVWTVDFSPDGQRLISGGKDRLVQVWSAVNPPERGGKTMVLPPGFTSLDVAPGGDKSVIVVDGVVSLVDAGSASPPAGLGTNNLAAFWVAPDEIVVGSRNPWEIKTWNLTSNEVVNCPMEGAGVGVGSYTYLPGPRVVVALLPDGNPDAATAVRWDVATRRTLSSSVITHKKSKQHLSELVALKGGLSGDGRHMAVHDSSSVKIFDLLRGDGSEKVIQIPGKVGIQGLALSPDGRQLAVAVRDKPSIMITDVETERVLATLHGHNLVILSLMYSYDGTRLLSSTIGCEAINLWDTHSWMQLGRFEAEPGKWLGSPRFLPDGSTISAPEHKFDERQLVKMRLFRAPSWEEISAAGGTQQARR